MRLKFINIEFKSRDCSPCSAIINCPGRAWRDIAINRWMGDGLVALKVRYRYQSISACTYIYIHDHASKTHDQVNVQYFEYK
jgi:hypothetical protein